MMRKSTGGFKRRGGSMGLFDDIPKREDRGKGSLFSDMPARGGTSITFPEEPTPTGMTPKQAFEQKYPEIALLRGSEFFFSPKVWSAAMQNTPGSLYRNWGAMLSILDPTGKGD